MTATQMALQMMPITIPPRIDTNTTHHGVELLPPEGAAVDGAGVAPQSINVEYRLCKYYHVEETNLNSVVLISYNNKSQKMYR